jgi:DNA-directed RNA polymerase subunit RPC12/RpoP
MDIVFHCSKCSQELAVDETAAGEQIDCPSCSEKLTIPRVSEQPAAPPPPPPPPKPPPPPPPAHKPLSVPVHAGPSEKLVKKTEAAAPAVAGKRQLRIRCIKRINCVEVGHDLFEEKVAHFLEKIGEENVVSLHAVNYGYVDTN